MKTTQGVVSNIAYCDKAFAEARLRQAVKEGSLRFFAFIDHPAYEKVDKVTGEVVPRKRHLHLFLEAGDQPINLDKMRQYLEQVDPTNPKPLGLERWTRTRLEEWLPYCLHDLQYCKFKGLEKPYYDLPLQEVVTSDEEYLHDVYEALPRDKWRSDVDKILGYIQEGQNWVQYCRQEFIPYNLIPIVRKAFRDLECQVLDEKRKEAHRRPEETEGGTSPGKE